MELGLIEIALFVIAAVLTFITNRGLIGGQLNEIFAAVQDLVTAVKKSREADSPGGKEVTEEERKLIRKEVDDLVMTLYRRLLRSRLLRLFGLKVKVPEDK